MNDEAGGKLWNRKPSAAPAVSAASTAAPPMWRSNAMIATRSRRLCTAPGQPVDPVRQVDDVHHPDQPDHGQHSAGIRQLERAEERDRDVRDDRSALDDDQGRGDLAEQLPLWGEGVGVVDRADQRDQAGAGDDRPGVHLSARPRRGTERVAQQDRRRQPQHRRDDHAGEDRHATERGGGSSASPRSLGITTAPTRRASLAASGVSAAATAIATRKANRASQYRMPSTKHGRAGGLVCFGVLYLSACAIRATRAIGSFVSWRSVTRRTRRPFAMRIWSRLRLLEGEPMPVGLPAVELDDEALLGPVEVGFVAVDRGVRERRRELGLSDQAE